MSPELSNDTENEVSDTLLDRLRVATAGTYDIAGVLGRGGMAVVFVAEDLRLRRTVAIKVMEPSLSLIPGMAERFLEEARTLARLQHPNVIVVHDVQRSKGLSFFVMTLIEGGGVDELCRGGHPLPIDQAQWILLGAARALAFAHGERIVHRDVKPANILVNVKGDVVLTDFGIAKGGDSTGLTKSGTQIGTPIYMSPEQFTGETVGPPSDQYALGITAYQLLTGAPPFTGELYALIAAHGTRAPVPIRQVRPDCPAYLANAVMRMLEKQAEDRWPSLDDVSEIFAANLPSDGGPARKQLASAARALHVERRRAVQALSAEPPLSPVPTHAPRDGARTVVPQLVVSVSPPGATIFVGSTLDLRAAVTLEDGQSVTNASVVWTSTEPGCVSVDANGRVTGLAPGKATIRATLDGGTSDALITIEPAPIARLSVTQTAVRILVGDALPLPVSVIDVTGAPRTDVTLTWHSHATHVATIESAGVVRAMSPGDAVVEVSFGNLRQRVQVTVVRRPVARVTIAPVNARVELGATRLLACEACDDRGAVTTAAIPQWRSSAPGVIHVDSTGRALAIGVGAARVTVTVDDATDAIDLEAVESPVAAIDLHVDTLRPEVGDEVALSLRVTDTTGGLRSATSVRVWSSDPAVAVVDESRLVLAAIAPGTIYVYAQSIVDGVAGVSTTLPMTVLPPAAIQLETEPAQVDLEAGHTTRVTVRARDRRGRVVPTDGARWTSESPTIVSVDAQGVVSGRAIGSGIICVQLPNADGTTVDARVPVLVRPDSAVMPATEPTPTPALVAPVVAPTVPLPRPGSVTEILGTAKAPPPPAAPTVPLPRPERADTTPTAPSAGRGATPVSSPPLSNIVTPAAATVAPPTSTAAQPRTTRGPLIGGGVVVALVAVFVMMRSGQGDNEPPVPPQSPAAITSVTDQPPTPTTTSEPPAATAAPNAAATTTAPAAPPSTDAARVAPKSVTPPPVTPPAAQRQNGATTTGPAPTRSSSAAAAAATTDQPKPPVTAAPVAPPATRETPKESPKATVPTPPTPAPTPESSTRRPEPARVVESIDAGEMRAQADRFVSRLRSAADRDPGLADFFSDGDDHKAVLANAPTTIGESAGRMTTQFDIRLTRFDAAGRRMTRLATVTLELTKRDGTVTTTSTSVGPLRAAK